ncbi:hypothetical protein ES703_31650 [subsurface metagenome]
MVNFSIVYSWDNLYCIYKRAGKAGEEEKVFCKKKIG